MTAHETQAKKSGRPTFVNVDDTGVSMSWKTAISVTATIVVSMGAGLGFVATLATKADVNKHDHDPQAHVISVINPYNGEEEESSLPQAVSEMKKDVNEMKKQVGEIEGVKKEVTKVQNAVHEDQAERLADRAADKVENPNRKVATWKRVKTKAMRNKREGRPLRDGLEDLVF